MVYQNHIQQVNNGKSLSPCVRVWVDYRLKFLL